MASDVGLDNKMIAQLREQFKKNYIDPPSDELAKFDESDVNRVFNDDLFALSFLHWKKEVIKDAVGLLAQTLEWRKQNNVADISVESIGEETMKRGVCYVYGRGMDGTRVLALIARLQTKEEKDKMRKVFLFWLERLQRNEPGQHVTFILDTHKTAMSNVDLGMIRFIIDSFTSYFPDLLEKIIVLDMPWIMNAIWSIVKQWMSEEQRSKIFFCSRKDLHKFVATDQRPISMAGTVDWTFNFPPFPDDLSQDHHFKNDLMNFKRKPGAMQENGDVRHTSDDQSSITKAANRMLRRGSSRGRNSPVSTEQFDTEAAIPSDSTLVRTPIKSRVVSRRTSSPVSSGMQKALSRSSSRDDEAKLKIHYTTDDIHHSDDKKQSFKSITAYDEIGDITRRESDGKMRMGTKLEEIALGNLLFMSPVSELVFTLEGERFEGQINIRNPNPVIAEDRDKVYVAFKVKTTSPERYHVKPSVGVVPPGDAVHIRIHISPGHEASMVKDRFLLLYKPIPLEEGNFPSHSEIAKFWKKNSDKSLHFEHRVSVAVDGFALKAPQTDIRKPKEDNFSASVVTHVGASQHSTRGSTLALNSITSGSLLAHEPSSIPSFDEYAQLSQRVSLLNNKAPTSVTSRTLSAQESPPGPSFVEYAQLNQRVLLLNNKITRIESDTRWMRRRMRHTMGLLFVVIMLMLFIIYEISVLPNSKLSTGRQDL